MHEFLHQKGIVKLRKELRRVPEHKAQKLSAPQIAQQGVLDQSPISSDDQTTSQNNLLT